MHRRVLRTGIGSSVGRKSRGGVSRAIRPALISPTDARRLGARGAKSASHPSLNGEMRKRERLMLNRRTGLKTGTGRRSTPRPGDPAEASRHGGGQVGAIHSGGRRAFPALAP